MSPDPVTRRLAAILSADVVGYSRLMAEDEAGTIRTLATYREEVGVLVRHHRGRVVDFTGDNFSAEFPTALDALECAVEIQRVLAARNASLSDDHRMQFRIGIHLGDVSVEDERLYGDGVNLAARLEGLAEPGGICISATVHEQVETKLALAYDDLGEQSLKNIPRPVRAYRIGLDDAPIQPGMEERTMPGFSGRPAIAVLAFDNLSEDPEQEYFADGIAEDLITRLSVFRDFPVIARNSSFTYKGHFVDVKQVSRELGARYVVEGSVRRAGGRVRISAQLIDATTGHHVWAEHYDRELEDVFALQDEITEAIVVCMHPELQRSEMERAARKDPRSLDVWEMTQRGFWHASRFTRDDNEKARELFEQAAELDPQFAPAILGLWRTHSLDGLYQWSESPARSIAEMLRLAERCVAIDDNDPFAHGALAQTLPLTGQPEKAMAAARRAVELNPSLPLSYFQLGNCLIITGGDPDEAIASLQTFIRLSPRDPALNLVFVSLAQSHFAAGRYEEAAGWARRSLERRQEPYAYRYLAASHAQLGQLDEARHAFQEMLRLQPDFSWEDWKSTYASADPDYVERYLDGLRKAGLEE